jgi:hypothetical protein
MSGPKAPGRPSVPRGATLDQSLFRSYQQSLPATFARVARRLAPLPIDGIEDVYEDVLYETYRPVLSARLDPAWRTRITRRTAFRKALLEALDHALPLALSHHLKSLLDRSLASKVGRPSTKAPRSTSSPWPGPVPARALAGLARSVSGLVERLDATQQALVLATLFGRWPFRQTAAALALDDPGREAHTALTTLVTGLREIGADAISGFALSLSSEQGAPPDAALRRPLATVRSLPPPAVAGPMARLGPIAIDLERLESEMTVADLDLYLSRLTAPTRHSSTKDEFSSVAGTLKTSAYVLHRLLSPLAPAAPATSPAKIPAGRASRPRPFPSPDLKARLDGRIRKLLALR